jgi:hypothetical protein
MPSHLEKSFVSEAGPNVDGEQADLPGRTVHIDGYPLWIRYMKQAGSAANGKKKFNG